MKKKLTFLLASSSLPPPPPPPPHKKHLSLFLQAAQSFLQTAARSAGLVEGTPKATDADVAAANQAVLAAAPRISGAMHSINQEMKFPNPQNGPSPEYIVSKVEDKVQERAPVVRSSGVVFFSSSLLREL